MLVAPEPIGPQAGASPSQPVGAALSTAPAPTPAVEWGPSQPPPALVALHSFGVTAALAWMNSAGCSPAACPAWGTRPGGRLGSWGTHCPGGAHSPTSTHSPIGTHNPTGTHSPIGTQRSVWAPTTPWALAAPMGTCRTMNTHSPAGSCSPKDTCSPTDTHSPTGTQPYMCTHSPTGHPQPHWAPTAPRTPTAL